MSGITAARTALRATQQAAAFQRRGVQIRTRLEWYGQQFEHDMRVTNRQRIELASSTLKDLVKHNISVPVTRRKTRSGRTAVVSGSRSKPGEYPRADTTRLRNDIFHDVTQKGPGVVTGRVGTTLHYGLILETRRQRSFLLRTLNENRDAMRRLLTAPRPGGKGGGKPTK